MGFTTIFLTGVTDLPQDGETAQEARDKAVKAGYLPPSQSPHIPADEILTEPQVDTVQLDK